MFTLFNQMRKKREGAFTMIELLVVVIIIAILAAVAVPVYIGIQKRAEDDKIKSDVKQTAQAVSIWRTGTPSATTDYSNTVESNTTAYTSDGGKVYTSGDDVTVGVTTAADGSFTVCGFSPKSASFAVAENAWAYDSKAGKFGLTATNTCAGAVNAAGDDVSFTPTAPTLTTAAGALTDGTQDADYTSPAFTATGAPTPTLSATGLPAGLSFVSGKITGHISATAPVQTYTVTVKAHNGAGDDSKNYTLKVLTSDQDPSFTSANTSTAVIRGQAYTTASPAWTVTASGIPAPTFTSSDLTSKTGLSIDATSGKITGTVLGSAGGNVSVSIVATNRKTSTSQTLVIPVKYAAAIATPAVNASLPGATQYTTYATTTPVVTATGFPAPTFSATGLPTGLTMQGDGTITGTPANADAVTTYTVIVTATNGVGTADTRSVKLALAAFVAVNTDANTGSAAGWDGTYNGGAKTVTSNGSYTTLGSVTGQNFVGYKGDFKSGGETIAYTFSGVKAGHNYQISMTAGCYSVNNMYIIAGTSPTDMTSVYNDYATAGSLSNYGFRTSSTFTPTTSTLRVGLASGGSGTDQCQVALLRLTQLN